jgi:hypothetical protein
VALGAADQPIFYNDVQAKPVGTGLFSQVDIILVRFHLDPVPSLSQLMQYRALLVYDGFYQFSDNVGLGNVLADYMDVGGGVVLGVFAFQNLGDGILGRIASAGYLPFTFAFQGEGLPFSMIADIPSHPILKGVRTFRGGSSSFFHGLTLAPGATQVAEWGPSPLIGTKQPTVGRVVELNFFPPSSDARPDLWDSTTDGARIMGNSLLWAAGLTDFPNLCLQDDVSGNTFQFDPKTGFYVFTRCKDGLVLQGTGSVRVIGGITYLSDSQGDHPISAGLLSNQMTGRAIIQLRLAQGVWQTISISATNPHSNCVCS